MYQKPGKIMNFINGVLSLPLGMIIPLKYLFQKTATTQYPEVRKTIPARFRGILINDVPECIVCDLCAKVCPVQCITITKIRGADKKFYARQFDIDIKTCLFCGLCTEACPTECLSMEGGYEGSSYNKENLVARFVLKMTEEDYRVYSKNEAWITYEHAREISAKKAELKKAESLKNQPPAPVLPTPPATNNPPSDSSVTPPTG